jgi:GNAT superfamily N-acetyltransferase
MNRFLQTIVITLTLSAHLLHAMEQQRQYENPFQSLNDDTTCPILLVRYVKKEHENILKIILERNGTWQSLIKPLSYTAQQDHTVDLFMREVNDPRLGGDINDTSRPYMILKKNTKEAIGFIWWYRDTPAKITQWDYLAVLEDRRRGGIGTLAACHMLQWEKSKGTQKIISHVSSHNISASSFLNQFGFKKSEKSPISSDIYTIENLQSHNIYPLFLKLENKNLIGKRLPHNQLKTFPQKTQETSHSVPSSRHSNSCVQKIRTLDMTGKILGVGGVLISLACLTRSAHPWLQQRSRYVYGLTAVGGLCYSAAQLMRITK